LESDGGAAEKKVKVQDVKVKAEEKDRVAVWPNPRTQVKTEGAVKQERKQQEVIVCPYLDTIDRKVLDFDFEKLCSVSLSNLNVYACLVCGKYFQGRGKNTHAYNHALEFEHHVFINLYTEQIYCLPDGYEVIDASLADVKYNLHPKFRAADVPKLDGNTDFSHGLDGTDFLPGVVGLNNTKNTDWLNVVVQALIRIPIIRNFFILESNYANTKSLLVRRFGELVCKMWNGRSFKGHVSPHELLQAVAHLSNKKFRIGVQSDPLQFMSWFIHKLHKDLGGTKKVKSSCISRSFQGELEVTIDTPVLDEDSKQEIKYTTQVLKKPFMYLSLDLPAAPLFKDSMDHNIIPQVPLFDLLAKFDGEEEDKDAATGVKKRYRLSRLPRYMMLHFKRFKDNNWFIEKNPTLVNFPIKNLDMKSYKVSKEAPPVEELETMSVADLKKRCAARKVDVKDVVEKDELVGKLVASYATQKQPTKYDLVGNVCHDGKPDKGTYRIHVYNRPTDTWYEMQDLHVWSTETMPQLVALSETYFQIYELQRE